MAKKKTAGRLKVVYAFLLLFGPALLLVFISTRGCKHKFEELPVLGKQINYSFTDAFGKKYTAADFKNKIVVISTIQVTCPEDCSISMWHIDQKIYQRLRKNDKRHGDIKLISFVTDGKGNPSNNLSHVNDMLHDHVEGYDSSIWILANGDAASLYNFEKEGKSLMQKGEQYYGGHAFQEYLLLLDRENNLRMVGSGKTEGTTRRFFEQVALLDNEYDKKK